MITTTLNRIRGHQPCASGWTKLLAGLGKTTADDEPLPYAEIVRINGLDDALWACRAEPQYEREWQLYAVWCARQVQHLMTDPRSLAALDVAERYATGQATEDEMEAARDAARDAAWDAWGAARDAAWDAWGAWNAWDAWDAARAAARDAARAAARDAAWGAAWDAARAAARDAAWAAARDAARDAAWDAARDAAWDAAWGAAREAQRVEFLRVVGGAA